MLSANRELNGGVVQRCVGPVIVIHNEATTAHLRVNALGFRLFPFFFAFCFMALSCPFNLGYVTYHTTAKVPAVHSRQPTPNRRLGFTCLLNLAGESAHASAKHLRSLNQWPKENEFAPLFGPKTLRRLRRTPCQFLLELRLPNRPRLRLCTRGRPCFAMIG